MLFVQALAASGPRFPSLTAEELARLDAGEVVIHADTAGSRVVALGVVKVGAAPESVWPAVLDMRARVGEDRTLVDVREYRRDDARTWYLEVDMQVLGVAVQVHHRYSWDPARGAVSYTLDTSKDNDLSLADGWYLVRADDGGSLLVFEAVTQAQVPVPGWVRRWLAREEMTALLRHIRDRAERGARRG